MNKRFSTLLATVLVAGGLSSVANATPADLSAKKYYHLKEATTNKYVGLSEEAVKADSLCLYDPASLTVKKVDQLLWSVSEKRVAGPNGTTIYQYEFTNKYTGEKLSMDPSRANHNLAAAAAMGVRPGSVKVWAQTEASRIAKTETNFNFTYTVKANEAKNDSVLWFAVDNGKIKLMSAVGSSVGSAADFQLVPAAAVPLDATELAAVMSSEGFKLNFKTNATSDAYENPFTKYTLKAVKDENATIYPNVISYGSFYGDLNDLSDATNSLILQVNKVVADLDAAVKAFAESGKAGSEAFSAESYDYTAFDAVVALLATGAGNDGTLLSTLKTQAEAVAFASGTAPDLTTGDYHNALIAIIENDAYKLELHKLPALYNALATDVATWANGTLSATDKYSAGISAITTAAGKAFVSGGANANLVTALGTSTAAIECTAAATTTTDPYLVHLQAVGQESSDADAIAKQMYVVADTVRLTPDQYYVRFALDTLGYADYSTKTGFAPAEGRNSLLPYTFKFTKYVDNVGGDSLAIETWSPVTPATGYLWKDYGYNAASVVSQAAVVGYRKSQNQVQITPILKSSADYNTNVANFTTVISFNMGDAKTDLDTDAYYFIISKNNADKTDASKLNANKDKAFYTSTAFGDSSVLVSRSQWVVEQEVAGTNNYVFMNRETGVELGGKLFTVDADNNIYAMGQDTIQLAVVALPKDESGNYVGYKHITEFNQVNTKYALQVKSFLSGDAAGYMVMKKDSTLAFVKGEIEDAQMVKMTEASIEAMADDSSHIASYSLMADEKYYVVKNASDQLVFTTVKPAAATATVFALRATKNAGQYEVLVGTVANKKFAPANQLTVDQNGNVSLVALTATNAYVFDMVEEPAPASLITLPKHVTIKTSTGDNFAMDAKNNGVAVREGDLKAAYDASDFVFWLDTAKYEDQAVPSYYITKGVAATEGVDASRLFMYNSKDSAAVSTLKDKYTAYSSTRFVFREAKTYGADSLIVMNYDSKLKEMAPDTVTIDSKAGAGKGANKTTLLKGINNFRFEFVQAKNEAEGVYNVKNVGSSDYVRNLNGVLVVSSANEGVKVSVETAEAPTANEGVEVSEVTVIAQNGAVRIANAEGKKVVITNILGQTIANTVITSSDAVIAAPAGVVVVAVEGEEAVKAIVK